MGSATQIMAKPYVVTSILGLIFQAFVSNLAHLILPGLVSPFVSKCMMHYIIQIPLNILPRVMGYIIICGVCLLLVDALILIIHCTMKLFGQVDNILTKTASVSVATGNDDKVGDMRMEQKLEQTPRLVIEAPPLPQEKGTVPPSVHPTKDPHTKGATKAFISSTDAVIPEETSNEVMSAVVTNDKLCQV